MIPASWHGRVQAPRGLGAIPTLEVSSFSPLPPTNEIDGSAVRRGGIVILLEEFPAEQIGGQGFRPTKLPVSFSAADFRPSKTVHTALSRKRFATKARAFSLIVVVGEASPSRIQLHVVNRIAASLVVQYRPESSPRTWRRLEGRRLDLSAVRSDVRCLVSRSSRVVPSVGYALGDGPAYPVLGTRNGSAVLMKDTRRGRFALHKTLWAIAPRYSGPILIRGWSLTTRTRLRFAQQLKLELRLPAAQESTSSWRYAPTYTGIPAVGCYVFQIDGLNFTKLLTFHASIH